jgi:hypothetical protein
VLFSRNERKKVSSKRFFHPHQQTTNISIAKKGEKKMFCQISPSQRKKVVVWDINLI